MGRKIFVTYKYGDTDVQALPNVNWPTRVRHYVDLLQGLLVDGDHIYKGEDDGEDLSAFKEESIASALRNKIYDSSLTIVMISKGMYDLLCDEADQWIPWEVSYSLKEHSREGRTSKTNAMLAVVLPDVFGSYDYFIRENTCLVCNCRTLVTDSLFAILRRNMFNVKTPLYNECNNHFAGSRPMLGEPSYIKAVKWSDFLNRSNDYIDQAFQINANLDQYNLVKSVS